MIDEYNAFLGTGKLLDYDDQQQQHVLRQHVDASENAVARIFEWNTFRLVGPTSSHENRHTRSVTSRLWANPVITCVCCSRIRRMVLSCSLYHLRRSPIFRPKTAISPR